MTPPFKPKLIDMLNLLSAGPHSILELATLTGLNITTVRKWVGLMYDSKIVYIAAWHPIIHMKGRTKYSGMKPAYKLGANADAARPTKLSTMKPAKE